MSTIFHYCQHVLGIGHFFRSLEICKSLPAHDVVFITGGPPTEIPLPPHVREVRLPGLMMDKEFSNLLSVDKGISVDHIKDERRKILFDLFQKETPDIFLTELYPFGRKAFRFELDPILKKIRRDAPGKIKVVCSVRDILVEKQDATAYEERVVTTLNRYFDAVMVHSDPTLVTLEKTFSRLKDISIPLIYTGFITPNPLPNAGTELRKRLGIGNDERLIIASAGGGKVGFDLLESLLQALLLMKTKEKQHSYIFTGPFISDARYYKLKSQANETIHVQRFTDDFLSYLAAADLSVSMAGYNTCMNILAAKVPALIRPFTQNREQRIRAEALADLGVLDILEDPDLNPTRLAKILERALSDRKIFSNNIDLEGARNTAIQLESWIGALEIS